jgi:hypothetical protein
MPWIALSEYTVPDCGQVPVAGRRNYPTMFALHMSRLQRARLWPCFLSVSLLVSALQKRC